jgi:hypothetical protein
MGTRFVVTSFLSLCRQALTGRVEFFGHSQISRYEEVIC